MGAADVWDEADGALGHGEEGAFGGDAEGAVDGDAAASAHDDAVHDGDVRGAHRGEEGVHLVLALEELQRAGGRCAASSVPLPGRGSEVVHRANVSARAQAREIPAPAKHHALDVVRGLALAPHAQEIRHHGAAQDVSLGRSMQGHHAHAPHRVHQKLPSLHRADTSNARRDVRHRGHVASSFVTTSS